MPRDGFEAKKHSKLCRLHFSDDDFTAQRDDSNNSRAKARGNVLSRERLKPHVVPHIWPNCPKYLSKELPKPRRNAATSEARATNELREREKRESIAIENNKICSLPDLIDKMTGQVPNGVHNDC